MHKDTVSSDGVTEQVDRDPHAGTLPPALLVMGKRKRLGGLAHGISVKRTRCVDPKQNAVSLKMIAYQLSVQTWKAVWEVFLK